MQGVLWDSDAATFWCILPSNAHFTGRWLWMETRALKSDTALNPPESRVQFVKHRTRHVLPKCPNMEQTPSAQSRFDLTSSDCLFFAAVYVHLSNRLVLLAAETQIRDVTTLLSGRGQMERKGGAMPFFCGKAMTRIYFLHGPELMTTDFRTEKYQEMRWDWNIVNLTEKLAALLFQSSPSPTTLAPPPSPSQALFSVPRPPFLSFLLPVSKLFY